MHFNYVVLCVRDKEAAHGEGDPDEGVMEGG